MLSSLQANGTAEHLASFRKSTNSCSNSKFELKELCSDESHHVQALLTAAIHQNTIAVINNTWHHKDIDRLHSCSQEGSIIITARPSYEEFRIESKHFFRERLCMRFGLPYHPIPCGLCQCTIYGTQHVDPYGYHLLSVCNLGNQRQATHNAVLLALSEMFTEAGLINRTEDSEILKLCNIDTKQRIDLTADNFEPGRSMNIDVSITDPRSMQSKSASAGKAAEMREKEKIKHYAAMIESTGSLFSPFVIESVEVEVWEIN